MKGLRTFMIIIIFIFSIPWIVGALHGNCILSKYEIYEFNDASVAGKHEQVNARVNFTSVYDRKIIIPVILNKATYKDDQYTIHIYGDIELVKNFKGKMFINDKYYSDIIIEDNEFNKNRIIFNNSKNIFNSTEKKLNITHENIKTMQVEINFTGIKQGKSYDYHEKLNYILEKENSIGNEIWDRMMSI